MTPAKYKIIAITFVIFVTFSTIFGQQSTNENNQLTSATRTRLKKFVNKRENLNEELTRKFVQFSFDYPESWRVSPDAGTVKATDFVNLHRVGANAPEHPEYISISTFEADCTSLDDKKMTDDLTKAFTQLVETVYSKVFSEVKVLPSKRTAVGNYDAFEIPFQGFSNIESAEKVPVWGRIVVVPGVVKRDSSTYGVTMVMFATPYAPEIKSHSDVGVKGELPVILKSFRLVPHTASNRFSAPAMKLTKMEIGSDVEEIDGQSYIVNESDEFKIDSQIVTLFQVENAPHGTLFKEVWISEDATKGKRIINENEAVVKTDSHCGQTYTGILKRSSIKDIAPGKYRFELYANGKLLKSIPFAIKN